MLLGWVGTVVPWDPWSGWCLSGRDGSGDRVYSWGSWSSFWFFPALIHLSYTGSDQWTLENYGLGFAKEVPFRRFKLWGGGTAYGSNAVNLLRGRVHCTPTDSRHSGRPVSHASESPPDTRTERNCTDEESRLGCLELSLRTLATTRGVSGRRLLRAKCPTKVQES